MNELDFFRKYKDVLNIRKIEVELELSEGTLQKAINGVRNLPMKHSYKVKKFLEEMKGDINF